jgi:plasmid stability protein
MSTTITIRTDAPLRRRLEERAAAAGKTLSELVREILEAELAERPLGARISALRGRVSLPHAPEGAWRKSIRGRNWRP